MMDALNRNPPPPPKPEHFCDHCYRPIVDGKWSCRCRGWYMVLLAIYAVGAVAVVSMLFRNLIL